MREIEFRGKRIDNGEWVYGSLIQCCSGKSYVLTRGDYANESELVGQEGCLSFLSFEVDPETVGQYTGLKDKNGIKIYEGDIFLAMFKAPFIVIWDEANGRFLGVQTNDGSRHFSTSKNYICYLSDTSREVIGNIHENPELMEVKNNV